MRVVSNTSPIIFLSKLNALHLLSECFSSVCIPRSVCKELGDIRLPEMVKVQDITPSGRQFVDGALGRLHIGELEAMVLCREIEADYVLLDDMTARKKAKRLGLKIMGVVGVFLLACRKGKISVERAVGCLDELVDKHGLYISADLLEKTKTALLG